MSTIVTRAGKGSALSWAETDANFTNLNTDKLEATAASLTGPVTITNSGTGNTQIWKSAAAATVATMSNPGTLTVTNLFCTGQYALAFPGGPGSVGIQNIGDGNAANNPLSGSTQVASNIDICGTSTTTANVSGHWVNCTNGATTLTEMIGYRSGSFNFGSGTVTRTIKYYAKADHQGTSNVGYQYGPSSSWTGNWSLYFDEADPSYHAGNFCIGSNTDDTVNALQVTGSVALKAAGNGLKIKEGSNAYMGVATLSAGTVVVSTTKVTATSRIFLTVQSLGTVSTPKAVGVTARSASTSFTITSGDATDTSVVAWQIVEPA